MQYANQKISVLSLLIALSIHAEVMCLEPYLKFEMPEGTHIIRSEKHNQPIYVKRIEKFSKGLDFTAVPKENDGLDVDLTIFNTWWNPQERSKLKDVTLGRSLWENRTDAEFYEKVKTRKSDARFGIVGQCLLSVNETDFAIVLVNLVRNEKHSFGIFTIEKHQGQWMFQDSPPDLYGINGTYNVVATPIFAYFVSGDRDILRDSGIAESIQDRLLSARTLVSSNEGILNLELFEKYIMKVRFFYVDADLGDVIFPNYTAVHLSRLTAKTTLKPDTIKIINSDLHEYDDTFRAMIMKNYEEQSPRGAHYALYTYGNMSSNEAYELMEKWKAANGDR